MIHDAAIDVAQVYEAADGDECFDLFSQGKIINLVLVHADPKLIPIADLVRSIRARRRFLPVLVVLAGGTRDDVSEVASLGGVDILETQFAPWQLHRKVVQLACEFECTYCGNCKQ